MTVLPTLGPWLLLSLAAALGLARLAALAARIARALPARNEDMVLTELPLR